MKKVLSLVLTVGIALTYASHPAYAANKHNFEQGVSQILDKFENLDPDSFFSDVDLDDGKLFVSGLLSSDEISDDIDVFGFLDENKALFDLDSLTSNLEIEKEETDELGFKHIKLQQCIDNIPIEDKSVTVHCNQDGQVVNVTADVEKDIDSFTTLGEKNITTGQAVKIAEKQFTYKELAYEPPVELVAHVKDGKAYKAYKVNVKFYEPEISNYDVYVEASSGKVLDKENKIRYDGPTTGTGIAVDGTTKPLNLYLSRGGYQLKDTSRSNYKDRIITYTASNRQTQPGKIVTNYNSNQFNSETYKAAVSAHYYAEVVYDFYKNLFGRDSLDNKGMDLISTVHYGRSYNNAFWDGSQMVYGDGDGRTFTYLSGDLDVVGHEMTHGVTSCTCDLNYEDQSGALNESMSDVMGVLIQTYDRYNVKNGGEWKFNSKDWVVGDDVYTPGTPGDALRSLADPTLYNQPAHMNDYYNTSEDNGGVHTNSGIPNKAAYLVAKSVGNYKTAQIYYRALVNYMTKSTDFKGAKNALVQSASDLYGANSNEVYAVKDAFSQVGVY